MSAICPNCGSRLGCSCELRTSLGGVRGCSHCIFKLNEEYRNNKRKIVPEKKIININRRNVTM